jgi:hypothetical protein
MFEFALIRQIKEKCYVVSAIGYGKFEGINSNHYDASLALYYIKSCIHSSQTGLNFYRICMI